MSIEERNRNETCGFSSSPSSLLSFPLLFNSLNSSLFLLLSSLLISPHLFSPLFFSCRSPLSFCCSYSLIWPRNVTEFSYRYADGQSANVILSFQPYAHTDGDFDEVLGELERNDYQCKDLSKNKLAKLHARYFGGGRANVPHERLFRFEFPESPGALKNFLERLNVTWNVSLFHYRNHGDEFGRVLTGIQIPDTPEDSAMLDEFFAQLGYKYTEETDNLVYQRFMTADENHFGYKKKD